MNEGLNIYFERRKAKITQAQLVKEVPALQRTTLRDIERCSVTPSEELAQAILDAIDRLKVKP